MFEVEFLSKYNFKTFNHLDWFLCQVVSHDLTIWNLLSYLDKNFLETLSLKLDKLSIINNEGVVYVVPNFNDNIIRVQKHHDATSDENSYTFW